MPDTLLVSGAAGHMGERVVAHLIGAQKVPASRIVAGTRAPEKLASLEASGIAVRRLDFEDSSSLAAALRGVDRMLLISTDAIDRPGRRLAQHRAAIEAAKAAGVRHVVYTSMPNPQSSLITFAPDHLGTERALAASALGWTVLRMNWYMENLLGSLPSALAMGKWYTAAGEGRVGYVSREDCARAAAAALAASDGPNSRLDVTGPQSLSVSEIAAIVGRIASKPLEVVQQSDDERKRALGAAGLPEPIVALVVSIEASIRAGKLDIASDTVERLTGSAPEALTAFLTEHQATLTAAR
jgi:NAD(P)H dehydrogenase (quinone)